MRYLDDYQYNAISGVTAGREGYQIGRAVRYQRRSTDQIREPHVVFDRIESRCRKREWQGLDVR